MSNNEKLIFKDDTDFERWFRSAAPPVPPREHHRQTLKMILQANFYTSRRRRVARPVVYAALILCLFITTNSSDLGSMDLDLDYIGLSDTGLPMYMTGFGDQCISSNKPAQVVAYLNAMKEANLGEMDCISGFRVADKLYLESCYRYGLDGVEHTLAGLAKYPPNPDLDTYLAFIQKYGGLYTEPGKQGGEYIGYDERFVDGHPVIIDKWRFALPEWGNVIIMLGQPLTLANAVANGPD